jgi:hypothetical protein
LLNKYGLRKKKIVYVKNEGSTFNAMTSKLKYVELLIFRFGRKLPRNLFWAHFLKGM